MNYTDDDPEILILSKLIRYADHHPDFNRTYVDDVYDFYHDNGFIIGIQMICLHWIYDVHQCDKFFVEEEEE